VGGGAAGNAAAEMLRREGHSGGITIISADDVIPYDRPTLSKDFLNGTATEEMIPLRSMDFYREQDIELLLNTRVAAIDPQDKSVHLANGSHRKFDSVLLATGAETVKLKIPGAELPQVCYLRSQRDCRAILDKARKAKSVSSTLWLLNVRDRPWREISSPARAFRRCTVLLDDSVRFHAELRRSRRKVGQAGRGRQYRGTQLQTLIPARRKGTRGGTG